MVMTVVQLGKNLYGQFRKEAQALRCPLRTNPSEAACKSECTDIPRIPRCGTIDRAETLSCTSALACSAWIQIRSECPRQASGAKVGRGTKVRRYGELSETTEFRSSERWVENENSTNIFRVACTFGEEDTTSLALTASGTR